MIQVQPVETLGLSPRMQGSRYRCSTRTGWAGPIPAHAGQPKLSWILSIMRRAYPRACRAAPVRRLARAVVQGLSPRMQGSPDIKWGGYAARGPIPAHAGQPSGRTAVRSRNGAYPRACRAAVDYDIVSEFDRGLSPRMQGSRIPTIALCAGNGPIPAHAGQPVRRRRPSAEFRAYPRACRAASRSPVDPAFWEGLSPRMQGSLSQGRTSRHCTGPIPAHAGQPHGPRPATVTTRAYPRACRAAVIRRYDGPRALGLSPRMQGSRQRHDGRADPAGPIPAHAGQPHGMTSTAAPSRAYPRACRAARCRVPRTSTAPGLSPRMQGSRMGSSTERCPLGPIPAHAGQPARRCHNKDVWWAYPRACGAAANPAGSSKRQTGLSPRMRGSPGREIRG